MSDGFTVDRAALAEAAQGINGTIGDLGQLGFSEEADTGRGFSGLALSGMQAGDTGLASAFGDFCGRWSWSVRSLVQDGNQIAARLQLSAGNYYNAEQSTIGSLKGLVSAAVGDPEKSQAAAARGSWSQAVSPGPASDTFSGQAWQQAGQNVGRIASATGHQVASNPGGVARLLAGGG